ncbi:hypothetical protein CDCA_CDCA16G4124 [Cyanidium caldarium]|uniref:Uncharacterized protein n=1 Tax=Cyanidium caldarium TaxID=2771 RepID=A0AAV9J1A9_CYACA|nr:hypothetical protein CDCA_CDCA16G4124 [Cyanidium caldarium]
MEALGYPAALSISKPPRSTYRLSVLLRSERAARESVYPLVSRIRQQRRAASRAAVAAHNSPPHLEGVESLVPSPSVKRRVYTPVDAGTWLRSACDTWEAPLPPIREILHAAANAEGRNEADTSPTSSLSSFDSADERASVGTLLRMSLDPPRARQLRDGAAAVPYLVRCLASTSDAAVATQACAALVNLDPQPIPVPQLATAVEAQLSRLSADGAERLATYVLPADDRDAGVADAVALAQTATAYLPQHLSLLRRLATALNQRAADGMRPLWTATTVRKVAATKPATAAQAEQLLEVLATVPARLLTLARIDLGRVISVNIAARFPQHAPVQQQAVALLARTLSGHLACRQ